MIVDRTLPLKTLKRNPLGELEPTLSLSNFYFRKYLANEVYFVDGKYMGYSVGASF